MMSFDSLRHTLNRTALTTCLSAALCLGMALSGTSAQATSYTRQNLPLFSLVPGGTTESVKLTGLNTVQYFQFGVRADELVTDAQLALEFTPSPSLLANWSQINVSLNGQLQETIALQPASLGKRTKHVVNLTPKHIKDANQITIEFVGHYRTVCETPTDPTLWLALEPDSRLTLNKTKIRLANDLSRFPAPFVDTKSERPTRLPIVFVDQPSDMMKSAAAIIASTAGKHAQWRGTNFPVFFNRAPIESHFVTFATNDKRPSFLSHLPKADGPEILMLDAPDSAFAKMLVLAGRDEKDILIAAKALGEGKLIMIGERVRVRQYVEAPARKVNDAPNWIRGDKEVTLGELMQYPQQLTARGILNPRTELELRLAPDLFIVGNDGLKMNLRYRYTQPTPGDSVQLQVHVNDFLTSSVTLNAKDPSEAVLKLPPFTGGLNTAQSSAFGLMHRNKLAIGTSYHVTMAEGTPDNCKSAALRTNQLEIDPSSSIGFDKTYNFARLPNLSLFAQSGYPFTRFADLSQTVAVMNKDASEAELTTLFNVMGRLSSATHVAGTRVTVTSDMTDGALQSKDILLIGELPQTLTDFTDDGALGLQTMVRDSLKSARPVNARTDADEDEEPTVITEDGIGSIISIQSPFDKKRTVVALMGEGERGKHLLNTELSNPNRLTALKGSVAVLTQDKAIDFAVGKSFTIGNLPWYQKIWLTVGNYPLLLVLCTIVCALILGTGILRLMRRRIRSRH